MERGQVIGYWKMRCHPFSPAVFLSLKNFRLVCWPTSWSTRTRDPSPWDAPRWGGPSLPVPMRRGSLMWHTPPGQSCPCAVLACLAPATPVVWLRPGFLVLSAVRGGRAGSTLYLGAGATSANGKKNHQGPMSLAPQEELNNRQAEAQALGGSLEIWRLGALSYLEAGR